MGYVLPSLHRSEPRPEPTRTCAYCEFPITAATVDSRGRCRNCGASERVVRTVLLSEFGLHEIVETETRRPDPPARIFK